MHGKIFRHIIIGLFGEHFLPLRKTLILISRIVKDFSRPDPHIAVLRIPLHQLLRQLLSFFALLHADIQTQSLHVLIGMVNTVPFHIRKALRNTLPLIVLQLVFDLKKFPDIGIRFLVSLRRIPVLYLEQTVVEKILRVDMVLNMF